MSALITGGSGFIGSHLSEALLDAGYRVTTIDNLSTGRQGNINHLIDRPGFQFVIDSITNEIVMDRLVSECDVIFHMAAAVGVQLIVSDPVRVIETNVLGTHAVLKAANRYRRKVLIASTSEIYGKNTQVPFSEEDDRLLGPTTKSRWSYSSSKAVDEFLGLAYHHQMELPVIIFRLFNTVGPKQSGQYGMVVPRFAQQALDREPLTVYGDGTQTRCFCDVRDTIRAIVGLSECPEAVGQVFNIGATDEISILDLARQVIQTVEQVNGPSPVPQNEAESVRFVPYHEAYETDFEDMLRRVPDITKIRQFIGWEPRLSLDQTLRDIVTELMEAAAPKD
ncbi:MAG: GDP-mannose 4,6-dehydratase [Chloroflexi bacterium]|nr:GDP-mannose 4,6-dehydratase [Chloroflexota bacterium]MDA1218370.1 GDP-mannose 4,6-dehydratase [Chloroflexota bacterium]PKB57474.1 MAG: nucleoside-diphosphate sugar epimerase [SAR202 cluster bacterium Casp-Chloro-G3]